MKRYISCLLCVIILLTLSGCSRTPAKTADGEDWIDSWMCIGTVLGVETVPEKFELVENKDALSFSDIYYTEWACGEPREYVNGDGETCSVYNAQIYLLLHETDAREEAETAAEEWKKLTEKNYNITDRSAKEYSGREFTIYKYDVINESNPYASGISAFGVWERGAVCVELVLSESFSDNADETLEVFLSGFHYA